MKQFFNKRVLALWCVTTCMFSMTACVDDLGEKMKNALVHTVIGMGIVFAVLLLMVWLISLFKHVPTVQTKFEAVENWFSNLFKGKSEEENETISETITSKPEVAVEEENLEENLIDDLELIAVITAAIAAMENTSADGLIVRSIKRSANSKWKRS